MQTIRLSSKIQQPVLVSPDALLYPNEAQAEFCGQSFAARPLRESVQYRSCEQLARGEPLEALLYYRWTLEKLARFGAWFESLLIHETKGCGVPTALVDRIQAMPQPERHVALAHTASTAFRDLHDSIMAGWTPRPASHRDIVLFRLFGGQYTVSEGRHRLSILCYWLDHQGDGGSLVIDRGSIRNDYYWWRTRRFLRRSFRQLTGR